jgi:hypothetical protein
MTFSDVALSNTFLACIAFVNLCIMALLYQAYLKSR